MGDVGGARVTGIPQADILLKFADAIVDNDKAILGTARQAVVDALGTDVMVDAAGVASNFQRMVRIADGCGIALDPPMQVLSEDLRTDLGIDNYVSAQNTTAIGPLKKLFMKLVAVPMFRATLRRASR